MKHQIISSIVVLILAINGGNIVQADGDIIKLACLVNEFRISQGRPPLSIDAGLNEAAQKHSDLQAKYNTMSHILPGEGGLLQRFRAEGVSWIGAAENVAFGQPDEETVTHSWIQSPDHRANMLGKYTHMGHGMSMSSRGSKYWTQDFGYNPHLSRNMPRC
ncbi:cysteine-rich secretory protein family-domain-containing protein [Syncephalis plumigaleata]|nr:cysteine-rich secretory protein family-domain-containing protein [Syncephalis plumigaleata]